MKISSNEIKTNTDLASVHIAKISPQDSNPEPAVGFLAFNSVGGGRCDVHFNYEEVVILHKKLGALIDSMPRPVASVATTFETFGFSGGRRG